MRDRTFGRTGWPVSEIGYGMWGMAGWTGSRIIPGMRQIKDVEANIAVNDGGPLDPALLDRLKVQRWDRTPTDWSQ